jgi:hypothetical protein
VGVLVTRPLPRWSAAVAAMIREASGSEPLLALFAEQPRGVIVLGLARAASPDGLVLIASDTDDETVAITLDRATVQALRDGLDEWLS